MIKPETRGWNSCSSDIPAPCSILKSTVSDLKLRKTCCIKHLGGLDTKSSISAFSLADSLFCLGHNVCFSFLGDKTKAILIIFPRWTAAQLSLLFLSIRLFYQFLLGIYLLPGIMILYPIPRFPHFLQDNLFPTCLKEKTWPQSSNLLLIFGSCFQRCLHILGLATRRHDNRFQSTKHIWMW